MTLGKEELEKFQNEVTNAVETKLEEKTAKIKEDFETTLETKLNAQKQELIELTQAPEATLPATELEQRQLDRLNRSRDINTDPITLEAFRSYMTEANKQVLEALKGKRTELDATIAGFAGYDDARGGLLIVPEIDKKIYTDFKVYDTGLMDSINFQDAQSRTMKAIVDTVEPDADVKAVKETLEPMGYTLSDGWFVEATLNLKDYDAPARITYDQIEDAAFRIEPYVNGKMAEGCRIKVAKDLWFGNGAQTIKGIMNYPQGTGYGKVGVEHVKATGTVTLDDIINLAKANRGIGALYIDKETWFTAITSKASDGNFLLNLGYAGPDNNRFSAYNVDAYVPFIGMPVFFDSAFAMPEAIAKNIKAAVLPPSSVIGYKRPFGRFMVKDRMKYREMLLTERYDAVLTQFNYVKLLSGTAA